MNCVENAVKNAVLVELRDSVLIVYDNPKEEIAEMFSDACKRFGADVCLVRIRTGEQTKREPPRSVTEAMKLSDVVLGVTTVSLTHTQAVRDAKRKGARIATMPGITKQMFPALGVDYEKMSASCKKLAKSFSKIQTVRIKTRLGTDLTLRCAGRKIQIDDGILDHPGSLHNLPSGEVGVAPVENSANGTIVVDTCMVGIEKIKNPIEISVRNGRIIEIHGRGEAGKLKQILKRADRNSKTLCEFSIGMNHKARLIGKVLNDEKAYGTCHVAFGDNKSIGGINRSNVHIDGVVKKPTIWFDDKLIMRNGSLVEFKC
jgi:leucyl aminopeptidase (aminopeptidase T)